MLASREYPGGVRPLRTLLVFLAGLWAGIAASAAVLKRTVPSRGDATSDEVSLVAILDGAALESRSRAFRGGSLFSWFGGVALDLRGATLAPGAHLDVHSFFGGIAVRVPPGWRIVTQVKAVGGGVAVKVPEPDDLYAPTLTLEGFTAFGGVAVTAKGWASEPSDRTEHAPAPAA